MVTAVHYRTVGEATAAMAFARKLANGDAPWLAAAYHGATPNGDLVRLDGDVVLMTPPRHEYSRPPRARRRQADAVPAGVQARLVPQRPVE